MSTIVILKSRLGCFLPFGACAFVVAYFEDANAKDAKAPFVSLLCIGFAPGANGSQVSFYPLLHHY